MLFIPAKTSRAWPSIQRSGKFCVNFLADDQAELSNQMASRGVDKFAGVSWAPPRPPARRCSQGTLGYVDCQIHSVHEAGDHYIVVGRVLDLGARDDAREAAAVLPGQVRLDRLVSSQLAVPTHPLWRPFELVDLDEAARRAVGARPRPVDVVPYDEAWPARVRGAGRPGPRRAR